MKYLLIFVALISLGLTGCGKKDKKPRISTDRYRAAGPNADTRDYLSPQSGSSWGEVTGTPQSAFQSATEGLVESIMDSQYMGQVSGASGGSTGVRFWGQIDLGAQLTTNMPSTAIRASTSNLRIVIWDEYAGRKDTSSGETIPEIPFYFSSARSGTVNSNYAKLEFANSYTIIMMEGYFDAENFVGVMSYQNLKSFDNKSPWRGELGTFVVRTCQFFKCN